MRIIFSCLALALSLALINLSWASAVQDKKQDKKKDKVLDVGKGITINSSLDNSLGMTYDAPDAEAGAKEKMAYQGFLVNFVKGKTYEIDMIRDESAGMNPYLFLEDAKKKVVAQDDNSGDNPGDARIVFKCPADGVYRIICTTTGGVGEGDFMLKVSEKK